MGYLIEREGEHMEVTRNGRLEVVSVSANVRGIFSEEEFEEMVQEVRREFAEYR